MKGVLVLSLRLRCSRKLSTCNQFYICQLLASQTGQTDTKTGSVTLLKLLDNDNSNQFTAIIQIGLCYPAPTVKNWSFLMK